ncbi:codeine O-demethylase-like [Silene latifolia]|uniref:codeine O-demethylase-like n=1 Tax=Silene latifolia TaxID=37657 RepID=UPI003D76AAE4
MADDLPYMDDNIIDLSLLLSSSPTVAAEELNKLRNYLSSWGCFQLVNHGMSLEFLDEVRDICKTFFRLPPEAKEHCAKTPDNSQGYGTDYMPDNGNPSSYRLLLTIYPEDQRHPDRWPNTPNFRDLMWEYTLKAKTVHDQVVQAMARSLNLEENSFLDGYGENYQIAARINYYPPFPFAELIRQVSKHADISATTLLLVDKEVEALELEKDGDWFKVPIIPEAIMIIVGDQLEIMSNGIFKSAEHRQNPSPVKDRMSWAMFFSPDLEKEIAPFKELVTEDRPAMYKPITRYIDLFEKYYPKGIRPITAVKL